MLTKDERNQIEEALAAVLAGQVNPKDLVQVIFKTEAPDILRELRLDVVAQHLACFVIEACLTSRWQRDPALLDMLLAYLVTNRGRGEFQEILLRVRQRIDPNPSVYNSTWLMGQRPFFDRQDFRQRVRLLVEENGRPILRVLADEESFGRTYSRYFLEHLEDRSVSVVHVLAVELSAGTGPSYQVTDLLEDTAAQLAVEDPIPPRADSSYPKSSARWMLKHIMRRPGRWLIVLDGFGQKGLDPEVRETVEALAAMVPSGQYRFRVRLVLLDYPHQLPGLSPLDVLEESLRPAAAVAGADLAACLADWDAERKRQGIPGLADGELARLADGMIERAPMTGKKRLMTLNEELSRLHALR